MAVPFAAQLLDLSLQVDLADGNTQVHGVWQAFHAEAWVVIPYERLFRSTQRSISKVGVLLSPLGVRLGLRIPLPFLLALPERASWTH